MRKRDKFRGLLGKGLETPAPQRPLAHRTATPNTALQVAIERHINDLPDAEKDAFRQASTQMTNENLLLRVKTCDDEHKQKSRFRPQSEALSRFLDVFDRFMAIVATGIQSQPEISSIIVGAVRIVIDLVVKFVDFFTKLSEMLCRFGDFLAPLAKYAAVSGEEELIKEALANVYGDLLQFCRRARAVFIDQSGLMRKWTSWRVFWRLQWVPFEQEFGTIESDMQHHLNVLDHSAQALGLNATLDASRKERERQERERVDDREKFLNWVSNVPFEKIHEDIYAKKHPGTGDWLFQNPEFQEWLQRSDSALLWCYGKPGAGKSVLASNVLEHITTERVLYTDVGICFAYYNYQSTELEDVSRIISALIKQLCRNRDVIPPGFLRIKEDAMSPSQLGNHDSFITIASEFREIFLVIDALDECPKDVRHKVLGFLSGIANSLPHVKIFVTSRRETDIEEAFKTMKTPSIRIEAENVATDISLYVTSETKRLREGYNGKKLYLKSDALEDKIVRTLTEKAEGMFLWVNLQLSNLCRISESQKDREVEKALNVLPRGLDATYLRIVEQIESQPEYMRTLAIMTFRWVMYAQRPLTTKELQHALAAEESRDADDDFELDTVEVILGACANLLAAERHANHHWLQIIRPIHYSVQEFFTITLTSAFQGHYLDDIHDLCKAHSNLAAICISYLQSILVGGFPCEDTFNFHCRVEAFPFLWYAALFFDYHLLQCGFLSQELIQLVVTLVSQDDRFLAALLQLRSVQPGPGCLQEPSPWTDFNPHNAAVDTSTLVYATSLYSLPDLQIRWKTLQTPPHALHRACSAGAKNLVAQLLATGSEVNESDETGIRPLYHAATMGRISILEMLINAGADVNAQGGEYNNALQAASYRGNEKIVELLLSKSADVNAQGGKYNTALQAASLGNNEEIVKLLLSKGADVNAQGGRYGTALQAASFENNEEIVDLLLSKGADVNAQGEYYGNALQAAASFGGSEKMIDLLLSKGADVNAQDGRFGNALQAAASHEDNEKVIDLLLSKGADVNAQGGYYGNALQAAASHEDNEKVIDLLLSKGADVNAQGGYYGNALQAASEKGHEKIIKMLLKNGAASTAARTA